VPHWAGVLLVSLGVILILGVALKVIHLVGWATVSAIVQRVYAIAVLTLLGGFFALVAIAIAIEGVKAGFPNEPAVAQSLCKAQAICRRYAMVRQECATAGDFNLCIRVKMAGDVASCEDNGDLYSDTRPTVAECLVWGALSHLEWLAKNRKP
jgi:hypothetical protein